MRRVLTALSSSLFFVVMGSALGDSITINDAQGLIDLSNNVNGGTTYSGTTVLLGSDIDFNGITFDTIGKDASNFFLGTFDGHGHTISNLEMISSVRYMGLFGNSEGLTIRNLVMDDSCSFTSLFTGPSSYSPIIGSVIGYCFSNKDSCTIESVVNVGSVSFEGDATSNLYIGGIIGYLDSGGYSNTLKNCVNYGSITHSGTSNSLVYLGGIAGISYGEKTSSNHVQNCANYGAITQTGSSNSLAIGGIAGNSYYTTFENCVSSGMIANQTSGDIGGIVGYINADTNITHCYWTWGTRFNAAYGYNGSNVDVTKSSLVTISQSTLTKLNDYAKKDNSWSNWVMLHLDGGRIGNVTQGTIITPQKHFPESAREETSFVGWFKDEGYSVKFDPANDNTSEITDLYAKWSPVNITTTESFISFSNNVNNDGVSYEGVTVLLNADIDLNGRALNPIGKDEDHSFLGTFDGQGHTISNLKMNSSLQHVGLFGYSEGLTIRNLVMDDSCSFASSYSLGTNPFVGSVVGYCSSKKGSCTIESVVNMGSLSFKGRVVNNFFIGGIIGYLDSGGYPNTLKNCVNYGSITHSGKIGNDRWAEIGGIAGMSRGIEASIISIQNCANYGTITQTGTSSILVIGGIAGVSLYTPFENCVSSGMTANQTSGDIGGIVGYISAYTTISRCYWTSDTGCNVAYGKNQSRVNVTESTLVSLNTTTLEALNEYAANNEWCNWVMLHLNGGRIGNVSQGTIITIQKHFPDPVIDGNTFLFWFKDEDYTEKFDPTKDDISGITDLYAAWKVNTLTFDFGNGTTIGSPFSYETEIVYPNIEEREGYTFSGWDNNITNMPANDLTITAKWTPENYTLTFDTNGGDDLAVRTKQVTFNATYGPLPTPSNPGFTFAGWFTDEGFEVTNSTVVTTPGNHTLRAQWEGVPTTQVEIVLGTKDLSREEVIETIRRYTSAEFKIKEIEADSESGETRLIVEFTSVRESEEFVRSVKESGRVGENKVIKRVGFNPVEYGSGSFSPMHQLFFLPCVFMM